MKICLVNAPSDYSQNDEIIPSLGLGYIYSMLKKNNIDVDWVECDVDCLSVNDTVDRIIVEKYDIVGFSTLSYNLNNVIKICVKLRKKSKDAFIYLGGYLPSIAPELLLKKLNNIIDCCMVGEGEYITLELINALKSKSDYKNIKGIAYLNDDGNVNCEKRDWIDNLDDLPFPALYHKSVSESIISGRGCYGNCSFCSAPQYFSFKKEKVVRKRSVENVICEIETRYQNGVSFLKFEDDNFAAISKRSNWIMEFCNELRRRNLNLSFRIFLRANDVIRLGETLTSLKEVGLKYIFIGIESFIQRQLDFYKKGVKNETNLMAVEIMKKYQIQIRMGFILLDPFSTIDEVINNLSIIEELEIHSCLTNEHPLISQMATLTPILGSEFHEFLAQHKMLKDTMLRYDFVNEDIAFFYQTVQEWLGYLEGKKIKFSQMLFKSDVIFMKEILLEIKKGNKINHKHIIEKYASCIFEPAEVI